LAQLQPVDVREPEIEQDHVGWSGQESLTAINGSAHPVPRPDQAALQLSPDCRVVFDDQDV
jgi:hypothetical protein